MRAKRARQGGAGRPRIGLNALLLSQDPSYRRAGVSRYIDRLMAHLPQVDGTFDYVAFVPPDLAHVPAGWEVRRAPWPVARPPLRIACEQFIQPWQAHRARLALFHAPVYVGPLAVRCPLVVTVHDLSFLRYPHLFRPLKRIYLGVTTRLAVRRARRVIVDSQFTAHELSELWGVAPERIAVAYPGVERDLVAPPPAEIAAVRERHGLDRYILYVGTLEPRKNLETLVEAYAALCRQGRYSGALAIAGAVGWYAEGLARRIRTLGLASRVRLLGYVPDADLPGLYAGADCFVYPSLYEGFGLPPLEAMACGAPTIVSQAASLPEVVGEAGLQVPPLEVAALVDALSRLLEDAALRVRLSAAGRERARRFTWEATARRVAELYHEILEGNHAETSGS